MRHSTGGRVGGRKAAKSQQQRCLPQPERGEFLCGVNKRWRGVYFRGPGGSEPYKNSAPHHRFLPCLPAAPGRHRHSTTYNTHTPPQVLHRSAPLLQACSTCACLCGSAYRFVCTYVRAPACVCERARVCCMWRACACIVRVCLATGYVYLCYFVSEKKAGVCVCDDLLFFFNSGFAPLLYNTSLLHTTTNCTTTVLQHDQLKALKRSPKRQDISPFICYSLFCLPCIDACSLSPRF